MKLNLFLRLTLIGMVVFALACSRNATDDVVDDDDSDNTAPATVTDLHTIYSTTKAVTLGWTAPGNDSMTGFAMAYDLRISLAPINAANFDSDYQLDDVGAPLPPGQLQTYTVNNLTPDSTYYFALKTRDFAGNFSGISNGCSATCLGEAVVTLPDTVLERIVREHIHKPTGDILLSDVDTVTELNADDLTVSDLSGLQYFVNLAFLHLINNDVTDLSPLSGLNKLWALNLSGNQIGNISPLAGLTHLGQLSLSENPITNLAPLANLVNLTVLSLDAVPATDFSPLDGMTKLMLLRLRYDNLSDISFLAGQHDSLKTLLLTNNNISDLTSLSGFAALEELQLQVNHSLSDLAPLQNLVNLRYVILGLCNIENIQPLIDNTGLGAGDFVDLTMNPLPDGAANVQLQQLRNKGVDVRF